MFLNLLNWEWWMLLKDPWNKTQAVFCPGFSQVYFAQHWYVANPLVLFNCTRLSIVELWWNAWVQWIPFICWFWKDLADTFMVCYVLFKNTIYLLKFHFNFIFLISQKAVIGHREQPYKEINIQLCRWGNVFCWFLCSVSAFK